MSFENAAGLIELGFFYSIVLGFCLWQIISMRRLARQDQRESAMTDPSAGNSVSPATKSDSSASAEDARK